MEVQSLEFFPLDAQSSYFLITTSMSNVLVNFLPPVHPKPNAAFATQYDDYRYQADTVYVTFYITFYSGNICILIC